MTDSSQAPPSALAASLADRYRIERELGQGGMARRRVAEATGIPRPGSLQSPLPSRGFSRGHQGGMTHRRVAEATATERPLAARQRDPGARESFRARLASLKRPGFRVRGHFSDLCRVAASAADTGAHPDA